VSGPNAEDLTLRASDTDGSFIGGLVGETYWRWLVVDVLAVQPAFRGRGVGADLVRGAEMIARERGCVRAHTTAWAFQGLGFWQKMGYSIVGELADHPDGHTLYWLRRDFD
jgi:GNAT superfamily N-acetyltransferase